MEEQTDYHKRYENTITAFTNELNVCINQTEALMVIHKWLVTCLDEKAPVNRYTLLNILAKNTRLKPDKMPKEYIKSTREKFIRNYDKYSIADSCFICFLPVEGVPHDRHHIIPLSKWGTNRPLNIITLCRKCHAYFHPWLKPRLQTVTQVPEVPIILDQSKMFRVRINDNILANITIVAYLDK